MTDEVQSHINMLKLLAVFRALQGLQEILTGCVVEVLSDNTTTVAYIRKQGGTRSEILYQLTRQILEWCETHQIGLSARHIPGKMNVMANRLSRRGTPISMEWKLDPQVFRQLARRQRWPLVDLFATWWNQQFCLTVFGQQGMATDALSLDW